MNKITAHQVKTFLCELFHEQLTERNLTPKDITDDFDLLVEGVVDSLGIIQMITALEMEFGIEIDFEELDEDELTVVGAFCHFVASNSTDAAAYVSEA